MGTRMTMVGLMLAVACGGTRTVGGGETGGNAATTTPTGAEPVTRIKQVIVAWGIEAVGGPTASPPKTKMWLSVTDENGAATSYPVGEIDAPCTSQAGGEMSALGTLRCAAAGAGAEYIAVVRGQEIIVLRKATPAPVEDGGDFEEQTRVTIPAGARVTFQP